MSDMSEKANQDKDVRNEMDEIREIIYGEDRSKFESEIQQLRKENKQLMDEINDLKTRCEKSDSILTENVDGLKKTYEDNKNITQKLEALKEEIMSELSKINESKLDKSEIGQAFIEWGTRVRDKKSS